jgi:hypothetical protein
VRQPDDSADLTNALLHTSTDLVIHG